MTKQSSYSLAFIPAAATNRNGAVTVVLPTHAENGAVHQHRVARVGPVPLIAQMANPVSFLAPALSVIAADVRHHAAVLTVAMYVDPDNASVGQLDQIRGA